jgi:hypothetical protein
MALFKLRLIDVMGSDICKHASYFVLWDCEALAVLGFSHVDHHFLKPGDFADISVSMVLHFVQSEGLLNA